MRIYRWAVSCCYEQNIYSKMKLFPSVSSSECQSVFYTRTRTIAQHMVCALSAHRKYRRKEFYVGEFDLFGSVHNAAYVFGIRVYPMRAQTYETYKKIHKLFLLVFLLRCIFWKWKKPHTFCHTDSGLLVLPIGSNANASHRIFAQNKSIRSFVSWIPCIIII